MAARSASAQYAPDGRHRPSPISTARCAYSLATPPPRLMDGDARQAKPKNIRIKDDANLWRRTWISSRRLSAADYRPTSGQTPVPRRFIEGGRDPKEMPAMPTAIGLVVPIGAALSGALAAGSMNFIAGRNIQTHQLRLGLIREQIVERRQLYSRFLVAADSNLLAVIGGEKSLGNLTPLLRLASEISLLASPEVQASATKVAEPGLDANAERTGQHGDTGNHAGAKKAFIEAARAEIAALEAGGPGKRCFF